MSPLSKFCTFTHAGIIRYYNVLFRFYIYKAIINVLFLPAFLKGLVKVLFLVSYETSKMKNLTSCHMS